MGLYPVLPAVLIATRSRYAEGSLALMVMFHGLFGPATLLTVLLARRPAPTWAWQTVVLGMLASVVASPLGFGTVVAAGALLGILAWTIGLRPADRRPVWFHAAGLAGVAAAALAGAAMLIGAVSG